eukprot:gene16079-7428_t
MAKIRLPWKSISKISVTVEDAMKDYANLFDTTTVGKLEGVQVSLQVNDKNPVFMKARTVPFAIRERYKKALDKLEEDSIIKKVEFSEWASPTVPIVKADGSLHSCWPRLTTWGISPTQDKVKAIHKAKAPNNVAELQSFIGMANYLRQFIPNFAEIMSPLYKLLQKNINWRWGIEEQQAFDQIKTSITSEQVLRHYDPRAPLVLQVDASSIGVGAVIFQPKNGTLKPFCICFKDTYKC